MKRLDRITAIGVLLLGVQTAARRKRPLIAIAGMTFVAVSQVSFLLLVWTNLRIYGILWRVCWVWPVSSAARRASPGT